MGGGQVVLFKTLEAAFLVTEVLLPAIPLDRWRVSRPVLPLIAGMHLPPLLLAVAHDLGVEGIGTDLAPVIIAAALPLTVGLATNELLRMVRGRPKNLLAIATTTITHQRAPEQNANGSFCPEASLSLNVTARNSLHIETPIEFFTASSPMGLLLFKPPELLLFYTAASHPEYASAVDSLVRAHFEKYVGRDERLVFYEPQIEGWTREGELIVFVKATTISRGVEEGPTKLRNRGYVIRLIPLAVTAQFSQPTGPER